MLIRFCGAQLRIFSFYKNIPLISCFLGFGLGCCLGGFTRDRSQPRRMFIPGLQYLPHPNVVLKVDYRIVDNWDGTASDEIGLGFGLVY